MSYFHDETPKSRYDWFLLACLVFFAVICAKAFKELVNQANNAQVEVKR